MISARARSVRVTGRPHRRLRRKHRSYPHAGNRGDQKRLEAGKPTPGICLSTQLIARALGAAVNPGPEKEIGWKPLLVTDAGKASPIRHLAAESSFMFHCHGDTFDVPEGGALLASTEVCPHQIYSRGAGTLAFQCQLEVCAGDLEKWFVGQAVEIAAASGINVPHLRDDTLRYAGALESQHKLLFTEWLSGLNLYKGQSKIINMTL